ncbi:hypothetical protein DFP72DRAFT_1013730 [Ephemerocybe angulata]|uniref:ER membrane protein complex subunit 1 n=1 Tax=Ephemerocybe angulata TaxID=980116 RepID=A0A8H6HMQ4_9AGAR|nr:hypothetical protein DFP72DRAFT_1013730 [Tulosesus angulatus]
MRFLPLLFLIHALGCWAIHESDVGTVDWHKKLVGIPLYKSPATAPRFASVDDRNVILTASANNVLAALDAKDGTVAWRYVFDPEDRIAGFYQNGNTVVTLSGPGGAIARGLDIKTGVLTFERRLHANSEGLLVDPNDLGKGIAIGTTSQDVYTLTNGHTVTRLDKSTGKPSWTWSGQDQSSLTLFTKLLTTTDTVYVIGVSSSFASYTLHVVSLSSSTGQVLADSEIPSSIVNASADLFAFVHSGSAFAAWLENGNARSLLLSPTLKNKQAQTLSKQSFEELLDVGLSDLGLFVGKGSRGSTVINLGDNASLGSTIGSSDASAIYAGFHADGKPHIAKSFWSTSTEKYILEVNALDASAPTILPLEHADVAHFTLHVASSGEPQVFLTTESGTVQLYTGTQVQWSREESLATTTLAEFVELPEQISAEADAKGESFTHRLLRHAVQAKDFPRYFSSFVRRFITGSYASATSAATAAADGKLSRDAFGFRQVIVTASHVGGKVFGIDSSNGDILWSRALGAGVTPSKIFTIKAVSDGVDPEVVIVTEKRSEEARDTVVFHLNALTGEDVAGSGTTIVRGQGSDAFLLDYGSKFIIILDDLQRVHFYPDNDESRRAFTDNHSKLSLPSLASKNGHTVIFGSHFAFNEDAGEHPVAYRTWELPLPKDERVQTIDRAHRGPVASLGKVLGDRTTLYKYLNPRLFIAYTVTASKSLCGLYLVDSAKGTVVYQVQLPANNGACNIQATLSENWLVYHYYESEVPSSDVHRTKGYRVVTVELYEGQGPDDKTESSDMSSFDKAATDVFAFEESYIFPHAISALAPTSTKFGISGKDLIVATKNHKIQSFPRRLLNPRRPHRKPTSQEAEEGLFQYDPIIYDDPKRVISHTYEVANVQKIVTAPALLESTSMVFAFGLDMFLTRVAPSGTFDVLSENFNKAQLVLTVSGLIAAIMFTRPMVQRKRLREKWYM